MNQTTTTIPTVSPSPASTSKIITSSLASSLVASMSNSSLLTQEEEKGHKGDAVIIKTCIPFEGEKDTNDCASCVEKDSNCLQEIRRKRSSRNVTVSTLGSNGSVAAKGEQEDHYGIVVASNDKSNSKAYSSPAVVDKALEFAIIEYSIAAGYRKATTMTTKKPGEEKLSCNSNSVADGSRDADDKSLISNSSEHGEEEMESSIDKAILTAPIPPKRPLSAYNLYFHLERQRILQEYEEQELAHKQNGEHNQDQDTGIDSPFQFQRRAHVDYTMADVVVYAREQFRQMLLDCGVTNSATGDDVGVPPLESSMDECNVSNTKKPKRKHRKTHGKISFTQLARAVAERWKEMSRSQKCIFHGYFAVELNRHKKHYDMWLRYNATAGVITTASSASIAVGPAKKKVRRSSVSTTCTSTSSDKHFTASTTVNDHGDEEADTGDHNAAIVEANTTEAIGVHNVPAEDEDEVATITTSNASGAKETTAPMATMFPPSAFLPMQNNMMLNGNSCTHPSMSMMLMNGLNNNNFNCAAQLQQITNSNSMMMYQLQQQQQQIMLSKPINSRSMLPLSSLLALQQQQQQQLLQSRRVSLDNGTFPFASNMNRNNLNQQQQLMRMMEQNYSNSQIGVDDSCRNPMMMMNNIDKHHQNSFMHNQKILPQQQQQYPLNQHQNFRPTRNSSSPGIYQQPQHPMTPMLMKNSLINAMITPTMPGAYVHDRNIQHRHQEYINGSNDSIVTEPSLDDVALTNLQVPEKLNPNMTMKESSIPIDEDINVNNNNKHKRKMVVHQSTTVCEPQLQKRMTEVMPQARNRVVDKGEGIDYNVHDDDDDCLSIMSSSSSVVPASIYQFPDASTTFTNGTSKNNINNNTTPIADSADVIAVDDLASPYSNYNGSISADTVTTKTGTRILAMPDAMNMADEAFQKACSSLLSANERAIHMHFEKNESKTKMARHEQQRKHKFRHNRFNNANIDDNSIMTLNKLQRRTKTFNKKNHNHRHSQDDYDDDCATTIQHHKPDDKLEKLQQIMMVQQKKLLAQQKRMEQMMLMMQQMDGGKKKNKATKKIMSRKNGCKNDSFESDSEVLDHHNCGYGDDDALFHNNHGGIDPSEWKYSMSTEYNDDDEDDRGDHEQDQQQHQLDDLYSTTGSSYDEDCDDDFCPSSMMFDNFHVDVDHDNRNSRRHHQRQYDYSQKKKNSISKHSMINKNNIDDCLSIASSTSDIFDNVDHDDDCFNLEGLQVYANK